MTRLAYYSDLHLEASGIDLDATGADVVAVVGDVEAPHPRDPLDVPGAQHGAVCWLRDRLPNQPVLFVPGNHDYEGTNPAVALAAMRRAAEDTNVIVLWNEAITLNGVRYIGSPLWSDPTQGRADPEDILEAVFLRTDLKRAFDDHGQRLTGQWLLEQHATARAFIAAELAAHPHMPTVVLTHWAPSPRSQSAQFRSLDIAGYWASDCEDLVAQANVWIHGHIHDSINYRVGNYPDRGQVLGNPRGSSPTFGLAQNPGFNPHARVDIAALTGAVTINPQECEDRAQRLGSAFKPR